MLPARGGKGVLALLSASLTLAWQQRGFGVDTAIKSGAIQDLNTWASGWFDAEEGKKQAFGIFFSAFFTAPHFTWHSRRSRARASSMAKAASLVSRLWASSRKLDHSWA